jgi:hypothetical protein
MKNLLKHHDDGFIWLKNLIQTLKAPNNEPVITQSISQHSEDLKWAQYFSNTAIVLYSSTDIPKKISRNYLMREAGWDKGSMPSYDKFPLARQQLESLCESDWHFYARRIVWAKLRVGAAGTSERGVLGASGVEHHQGQLVLNHFLLVRPNQILGPGTIMEILKKYKISKDWEGPLRNCQLLKPGRSSSRGGQVFELA